MDKRDAELIATLVEALASLNQRVRNVESLELIAGPKGDKGEPGESGADGRDGLDAPPVTDEQIRAQAVAWLEANITQPADGKDGADGRDARDPTAEQIQLAVDLWFELNRDSLRGERGFQGERGRDGADGERGADGRNGRDGVDGLNGTDGTGIALIEQRESGSFWITLTDGSEVEIELPEPKRLTGISGGGLTKAKADELYAPIGSGGGTSQQQVFIGAPSPLPNYPALVFDAVTVDGQTVYTMRLNDGIA